MIAAAAAGLRGALVVGLLFLWAPTGVLSVPCNASVLESAAAEYLAASWDDGLHRTRECASCVNFSVRGESAADTDRS